MTDQLNNLKDKVLAEIRSGQVSMRPRLYFTLQIAALVLVALAALVVSVFILNFILFSIRLNRQDILLGHGLAGWAAFVWFFPWVLLALDVLLVLILQWLVRKFAWGWRVPVLYLLGGLLALTALSAFAIERETPFNDRLFEARHRLPEPFGGIYRQVRHHDVDDTLRQFGISPAPDKDDMATGTPATSSAGL